MSSTRSRAILKHSLVLALPTVVIVAAAVVTMLWRVPTRVTLDLTANRAVFTVGGAERVLLLSDVQFSTITLEKFARISLRPERLQSVDLATSIRPDGRIAESDWRTLNIIPPVVLQGLRKDLSPSVTFEAAAVGTAPGGKLTQLWIHPGTRVTLEVRGLRPDHPTVELDRNTSRDKLSPVELSFTGLFHLTMHQARATGIPDALGSRSPMYRGELGGASPLVEVESENDALLLSLAGVPATGTETLVRGGIPVDALCFERQGPTGAPESSFTGVGAIGYPDFPALPRIVLGASDLLRLDGLSRFRIENVAAAADGLRFRATGMARRIMTSSGGFAVDHRRTSFDAVWQNPRLAVLFGVSVWALTSTIAGYRLFREVVGRNGGPRRRR